MRRNDREVSGIQDIEEIIIKADVCRIAFANCNLRIKRNAVEYDCVGGATHADADELICFVKTLEADVLAWLKKEHQGLSHS